MPYLLAVYLQTKLLCIYVYKNMTIVEKHSNMILSYSIPKKYDTFFRMTKISLMEFNQYKYVYNNLGLIIK